MTNPITEYNGKRIADMGDEELVMALARTLADNLNGREGAESHEVYMALRSAILLRMSQPKWVKVSERLPDVQFWMPLPEPPKESL